MLTTVSLAIPALALSLAVGTPAGPPTQQQPTGTREVRPAARAIVPISTSRTYGTLIALPEGEEVLSAFCMDPEWWVVDVFQHAASIRPSEAGRSTSLHLVTSRRIYSFVVTQPTAANATGDVVVHVLPETPVTAEAVKYYSAAQVQQLQADLESARVSVETSQREARSAISDYKRDDPVRLSFAYKVPDYGKPFFIRAVWHDGQFTYLKSDARELPALYEWVDGKPALLNFQVHDGTYVVPKVLEKGYLALGKKRLTFELREAR